MQSIVPYDYNNLAEHHPSEPVAHEKKTDWIEKGLDLFFRRKWIIIGCFVIVVGASAVYNLTLEPQYFADSYVMLDLGKTSVDLRKMSGESDPYNESSNLFVRNDRSISGELLLLQISDQLEQRVMERLKKGIRDGDAPLSDSSADPIETSTITAPRHSLQGYVRFSHERESDNIIRITGISPDPREAADIANLYAEEYIRLTREANRTYLSSLRNSLEEKEQQRLYDLSFIEQEMQEYLPKANAAGLASSLVSQIAALEMQRDEVNIQLQLKQSTLDTLMKENAAINPTLVQRVSSGVDRQINDLQDQRAELETTKSQILLENPNLVGKEDQNPTLQRINQQILQLETALDSLSRIYINEAVTAGGILGDNGGLTYLMQIRQKIAQYQLEINELNAKLNVIDSRIQAQRRELGGLPDVASKLSQLERSRLHAEQMYQYVTERLQETRIAEESDPGYAQLIRAAQPPRFASNSNLIRGLVMGVFLGLMVGFGAAVARDRIDNRIYKSDFFSRRGLRELGTIPDMKALIKASYEGRAYFEHDGRQMATSLVAFTHPNSPITEAYRHLRNTIQFGVSTTNAKCILVTSPSEQEGKSTTAANLAIVMAQYGYKTLLIDADLHRPRLGKMFGIEQKSGLKRFLLNDGEIDLKELTTCVEKLSLLTAGMLNGQHNGTVGTENGKPEVKEEKAGTEKGKAETEAGNSNSNNTSLQTTVHVSDLLGSQRMEKLLVDMKEIFDVVIVDTPPILATSDAVLLSTRCDGTLLVTRAGKTQEGDLEYASNMLAHVGTKILGVLLNGFDIGMAYGLQYRYRDYMKYGYYSSYSKGVQPPGHHD